jgi:hypothetical protein
VIRSAELRNRANPHAARARLLRPSNSCRCQTQSYLRIGQRYLRMTQNPL